MESPWCRKAELSEQADSETPRRLPHAAYALHRTGCSQEDDQLLREGRQRQELRRRYDSCHVLRSGPLDEKRAAAVFTCDLRSSVPKCRGRSS
jgi:hypothetical protein